LLRGAVLTLAGHDHQAAALGARATGQGHELDSSGTAEALVRTIAPMPSRADVARLALTGITTDPSIEPGHWSLLGGTEGGLAQLRALERLGADVAELDAAAEAGSGPGTEWRTVVGTAADEALALHRAMDDVVGAAARVVVTGGWRHSAEVMRAKVARFGPLEVSSVEEAGALGAATLAARACGALGPNDHLGDP
jgi:sugar (pentulose or hexulose) kinase